MKIAVIIVRTLMGLLFLFGSISYFFNLVPTPELSGNVKLFMDGMIATGYMLPLIKAVELVCGVSFVTGRFVPLATILISPIIVNIFLFHAYVDPSGVVVGALLVLGNAFLAYADWGKYRSVLTAK